LAAVEVVAVEVVLAVVEGKVLSPLEIIVLVSASVEIDWVNPGVAVLAAEF
jgi:hypothetical protein